MRNPLRKAAIFLGVALSGAALVWLGATGHAARGEHWASTVPIVLGVMMAMVGIGFLVPSLFFGYGRAKLLAGRGVIARWHVEAVDWDRFREIDRARARVAPALANELWIRKSTPPAGVDVIIGKTSMLVDGSYHVLRPGGQPEIRGVQMVASSAGPPCLEFAIVYVGQRGMATLPLALRFPFPAAAQHDAQRVYEHFQAVTRPRTALALRRPMRTIGICIGIAVLSAAAAGAGFAMNANGRDGDLPATLAVGGTIFGLGALLLAGLVMILRSRTRAAGGE